MSRNITIENWMAKQLGLNGNSLVLFAIIWRESKQGQDMFIDNYADHSAAMNTSIPTYYNTLGKLVTKGLLRKVDGGYTVEVKRAA